MNISTLEKVICSITGYDWCTDGFIEVVVDFTHSRYFNREQVPDAVAFATEQAKAGHEIHFGPAVKTE